MNSINYCEEPARLGKRSAPAGTVMIWLMLSVNSASAQFILTPVAGLPNVASGSVAWGDYDNDGRLDFLLSGYADAPKLLLWRNTGSGFSDVTASVAPGLPGVFDSSVAWGGLR